MRSRFLVAAPLVLAALVLPSAPATAAWMSCPSQTASIRVHTGEAEIIYDRTKSVAALSRIAPDRRSGLEAYSHTLGITAPKFASDGEYRTVARRVGNVWCASVLSATIEVTLQQTVYLASELKQGSCVNRVVLTHERKHTTLNSQFVGKLVRVIQGAVRKARLPGSQGATAEAAQKAAIDAMDKVIGEVVNGFAADLRQAQEAVDTPREYDRIYRICGEENVRNLMAGARG